MIGGGSGPVDAFFAVGEYRAGRVLQRLPGHVCCEVRLGKGQGPVERDGN